MVICLELGANDLHIVQLVPLSLHHLCFSKIQNGLSFWYQLTWVVPDKTGCSNVIIVVTHDNDTLTRALITCPLITSEMNHKFQNIQMKI